MPSPLPHADRFSRACQCGGPASELDQQWHRKPPSSIVCSLLEPDVSWMPSSRHSSHPICAVSTEGEIVAALGSRVVLDTMLACETSKHVPRHTFCPVHRNPAPCLTEQENLARLALHILPVGEIECLSYLIIARRLIMFIFPFQSFSKGSPAGSRRPWLSWWVGRRPRAASSHDQSSPSPFQPAC